MTVGITVIQKWSSMVPEKIIGLPPMGFKPGPSSTVRNVNHLVTQAVQYKADREALGERLSVHGPSIKTRQ